MKCKNDEYSPSSITELYEGVIREGEYSVEPSSTAETLAAKPKVHPDAINSQIKDSKGLLRIF